METLPDNIRQFLITNKIASVCFVDENKNPYCISCFFVFNESDAILIFKSSFGTSHEDYTRSATAVSGTILPAETNITKIAGIQFTGKTLDEAEINSNLHAMYYNKYPFGRVMGGYIWVIKPDTIKFTDNSPEFGRKTIWMRNKSIVTSPTRQQ